MGNDFTFNLIKASLLILWNIYLLKEYASLYATDVHYIFQNVVEYSICWKNTTAKLFLLLA